MENKKEIIRKIKEKRKEMRKQRRLLILGSNFVPAQENQSPNPFGQNQRPGPISPRPGLPLS